MFKNIDKEVQILIVVIFFTLVTYWGVEPFAHSQMHKHVEEATFVYGPEKDKELIMDKAIEESKALTKEGHKAEAKKIKDEAEARVKKIEAMWEEAEKVAKLKGDPQKGKDLVMGAGACTGCHGIKAANMASPMDPNTAASSYGVNPPDLSNIGALYDTKFLAALIKNPPLALGVDHKFNETKTHPMTPFFGAGGDINQEIADMIAYLKSIAPKEITPKEAYDTACGRCHSMRYAKWSKIGTDPKFKTKIDELKYRLKTEEYDEALKKYMGKLPPDLSIIIRARSENFLSTFIENPQVQLPGTSMPRVGLTEEGYEKVKEYLTEIGDPSKPKREAYGPWVILFFIVFTGLAYLWKKSQWKDL